MRTPFYSEIPAAERPDWSDGDLSGAIWDEGFHRLGNDVNPRTVATLPFGFRAVLAEGLTRAHVEGDGLPTAIWNDDGAEMFALAAECHRAIGSAKLADLLNRIAAAVMAWQTTTGQTPRSLEWEAFKSGPLARTLDFFSDDFDRLAGDGFLRMMEYLRAHPNRMA